jgi:transposase InsO family protein
MTSVSLNFICGKLGLYEARVLDWRRRRGRPNQHNGAQPKETWIEESIRQKIIQFYLEHEEDGYRRCAYMMLDADIAAVCPTTVYNVLKKAGALRTRQSKPSSKGKGFHQPKRVHEQWHSDITYIKIGSKYFYLISFLDGFSRMIVHSELREAMSDLDVNIAFQAALEACPEAAKAQVRVISDNGGQYTGKEFRNMIVAYGLAHTRTSPYYPQSNGKIERWHQTLKIDISEKHLDSKEHAQEIVTAFVKHYNEVRLHSALGYITPKDMAEGRQASIHAERDRKLEQARELRGWSRMPKAMKTDTNTSSQETCPQGCEEAINPTGAQPCGQVDKTARTEAGSLSTGAMSRERSELDVGTGGQTLADTDRKDLQSGPGAV